jgi:hypothetical protein
MPNVKTPMHHQTHPILVFDDFVTYARKGRPLAVVERLAGASLVHFQLAHLATQPVRCNTFKTSRILVPSTIRSE